MRFRNILILVTAMVLCIQVAAEPLGARCEKLLADQREYDKTHHAISVAKVLSGMTEEMQKSAVSNVLPLLAHPEWELRYSAARALIGNTGARTEGVRFALVQAVAADTNQYSLPEIIQAVYYTRAAEATTVLSSLAVSNPYPHVRYAAVEAQFWIRDTNAVPSLIQATRDPSSSIAIRALYVLGNMGDSRAVPRLVDVAKGDERDARISAVQALGMIGSGDAAPLLRSLLTSTDASLLKQVVWALGRAHDAKTVAALLPLLDHRDATIAKETRLSLVQIGNDEVLTHFIGRYRTDPDDSVALDVINSIYSQRDRAIGEVLKDVPADQMDVLARHLSTVSKKKIDPAHIKSIRHLSGTLFVQVVFDDNGFDFIVIRADEGTFKGAKVILSWIE